MGLEIDIKDITGKNVRKLELPPAIFDVKPNPGLVHEVVVTLQANKRQGTHATKTRAFVSGGGKKPFRQKGTGNARQGSSRSPLMRGGAISHGPQPRSYHRHIPRKMRNMALRVVLSDRRRSGNLFIIDDILLTEYKTKKVVAFLNAFGVSKTLLTDERKDDFLYRSVRNIYRTAVVSPLVLNVLDVVGHDSLIVSESGLQVISRRLSVGETA